MILVRNCGLLSCVSIPQEFYTSQNEFFFAFYLTFHGKDIIHDAAVGGGHIHEQRKGEILFCFVLSVFFSQLNW